MTEYINGQWRLPNEAEGIVQNYSMALSSNQYLSFAGTFDLFNFSISFWIKVDSYSPEQVVLGGGGSSSFTFESATSVRVEVNNTSYNSF